MGIETYTTGFTGVEERLLSQLRTCGRTIRFRGGGRDGQRRALSIMAAAGDISQQELMSLLDVRAGSLSELLGKLEERGFVARSKNEADRRSVNISITDTGRAELEIMQAEHENAVKTLFVTMSEQEKATLSSLLDGLLGAWAQDDERA